MYFVYKEATGNVKTLGVSYRRVLVIPWGINLFFVYFLLINLFCLFVRPPTTAKRFGHVFTFCEVSCTSVVSITSVHHILVLTYTHNTHILPVHFFLPSPACPLDARRYTRDCGTVPYQRCEGVLTYSYVLCMTDVYLVLLACIVYQAFAGKANVSSRPPGGMSTKRGAPAPAVVGSHFVKQVKK